MLLEKNNT